MTSKPGCFSMMIAARNAILMSCLCAMPVQAASGEEASADPAQAAAFLAADGNGDKQLDAAEFTLLIDAMAEAGRSNAIKVRRFGAHALAFGRIDANGDGVLSIPELGAGKELAKQYSDQP